MVYSNGIDGRSFLDEITKIIDKAAEQYKEESISDVNLSQNVVNAIELASIAPDTNLCCDVIQTLRGKTLVTAESLTGGGIGAALTSVSGASAVYKGGIISYTNEIKHKLLDVPMEILNEYGAVSAPTAKAMAEGARKALEADVAVSVTGLAGPSGDDFGNPVGTVFIGYSDENGTLVKPCLFSGDRDSIRNQTIEAALQLVLSGQK